MKKKNVLTMALSVSLVGVIAVGGTLAYLSSTTDPVTNTFTFDDSIEIELKEHNLTQLDSVTNDWKFGTGYDKWDDKYGDKENEYYWVNGNTYSDVVPGQELKKDPTVKFVSVPKNGANLYVSVSGVDDWFSTDMDIRTGTNTDGVWVKIADIDGEAVTPNTVDGIYKYVESASGALAVIDKEDEAYVKVFDEVTVNSTLTNTGSLDDKNIVIEAYSVQATGNLGVTETRDQLAINALKDVD